MTLVLTPGAAFDPTHEFNGLEDPRCDQQPDGTRWCMLCKGFHPAKGMFSNGQMDWPTLYFSPECARGMSGAMVHTVYLREVNRILRGLRPQMQT